MSSDYAEICSTWHPYSCSSTSSGIAAAVSVSKARHMHIHSLSPLAKESPATPPREGPCQRRYCRGTLRGGLQESRSLTHPYRHMFTQTPFSNESLPLASGISCKMQEIYLIVFCTRYTDLLYNYISFYNTCKSQFVQSPHSNILIAMKVTFIVSTAYLIYLMRYQPPSEYPHTHKQATNLLGLVSETYDKAADKFPYVKWCLPAAAILALAFSWGSGITEVKRRTPHRSRRSGTNDCLTNVHAVCLTLCSPTILTNICHAAPVGLLNLA